MAKKKTTKKAASEATNIGYATTDWLGHPNYECQSCKYKTLDLDKIEAHVAARHGDTTAAD